MAAWRLVNVTTFVFVTPIVAFYLLRDWDRLIGWVDALIPRPHVVVVREQARQVDDTLAGFVRGQATVCVVLGLGYGLALSLAGLEFGFVIGILSGILAFIPYVGSIFGLFASVGLALLQFDDPVRIGIIAGIFIVGQVLEGNVLTPKLVGERVGLHPVWVIFSLFAGGAVLGFMGMLLALPVAASVGVLTRFAVAQYRQSPIYLGDDHEDDDPGDDPGEPPPEAEGAISHVTRQFPLKLEPHPDYTAADFLSSEANRAALALVQRMAGMGVADRRDLGAGWVRAKRI